MAMLNKINVQLNYQSRQLLISCPSAISYYESILAKHIQDLNEYYASPSSSIDAESILRDIAILKAVIRVSKEFLKDWQTYVANIECVNYLIL